MKKHRVGNVRKDKKMFMRTAKSAKRINLAPRVMRGGIRL